jgi:glycosyltransferase involved in cell wall biosynthesis
MIEKTTIHYDCTKLVQLLNAKQYNGILRADVEYLRHLLKNSPSYEIYGIFEATQKSGKNYFVHISDILIRQISDVFNEKWNESTTKIKEKEELIENILSKIKELIEKIKIKKDTRIDNTIFEKREKRALYINCSFFSIVNPDGHAEQMELAGLRPIYVIYDILPLEYPEFFWNDNIPVNHLNIITAMAKNKSQFVAISENVKAKLEQMLKFMNVEHKEICVARCGVSDVFMNKKARKKENKFTIFCTIEPRKNHILLLNIWKELINSGMTDIPKLSIIGRRGWFNEDVFRLLDKSPAVREYVTEFNKMTDEEMINEISTSKATLFPSFGEGWGLPIVESLSMGIPVLCSDIEVHRECSQGMAEYISPLDGIQWMKKIIEISKYDEEMYIQKTDHLKKFEPITWTKSAESILNIIHNQ